MMDASPKPPRRVLDVQRVSLLGRQERLMQVAMQATEDVMQALGRAQAAGVALPAGLTLTYARYHQMWLLFQIPGHPALGRAAYTEKVADRIEAVMDAAGKTLDQLPADVQQAYAAWARAMTDLKGLGAETSSKPTTPA